MRGFSFSTGRWLALRTEIVKAPWPIRAFTSISSLGPGQLGALGVIWLIVVPTASTLLWLLPSVSAYVRAQQERDR